MEIISKKPYLTVICLLALTIVALLCLPDGSVLEDPWAMPELPDNIGNYRGEEILFCQNPTCRRSFVAGELEEGSCPSCGGEMGLISLEEKSLLPEDTIIVRKIYRDPEGTSITVSIVIAGKQRTSVHRPQACLIGQGYRVTGQRTLETIVRNDRILKVTLLDLQKDKNGPGAYPGNREHGSLAYWFVSREHETPYYLELLLRTTIDSIVEGGRHRWSYVSLMLSNQKEAQAGAKTIKDFIAGLYPYIHATETRTNE